MYSIYKYYDLLEMEKQYAKNFSDFSENGINLLPPLFHKDGFKYYLAYLVLASPKETDHHTPVKRPIGVIFRNRKNGKVLNVFNFNSYEFIDGHDDFDKEYYALESSPKFLPNRSPENEEKIRLLLEKALKISLSHSLLKPFNEQYYESYKTELLTMFPQNYHCFFEALEKNDFRPIDENILKLREQAKKAHIIEFGKKEELFKAENEKQKLLFLNFLKKDNLDFLLSDIIPSIKNKSAYTKYCFFTDFGKMLKNTLTNLEQFAPCYLISQTPEAKAKNSSAVTETQRVAMVKMYAKACVQENKDNKIVNNICKNAFNILENQIFEEFYGKVITESKQVIKESFDIIKNLIMQINLPILKSEMESLLLNLEADYFDTTEFSGMSNFYIGYQLYYLYKLKKEQE